MNFRLSKTSSDGQSLKIASIVILTTLLILVAVFHYGVHKNAHQGYDPLAVIKWRQPPVLDEKISYTISNDNWLFDFTGIEEILWRARFSLPEELLINSETTDLLESASDLLPDEMSTEERQRLTLLVQRTLPGEAGRQLGMLLNSYSLYQQEYRSYLSEINSAAGDKKLALLQSSKDKIRQSQRKFFGRETAEKLFSKQNVLRDYLNDRRTISLNQELTISQKKAQLSALQEAYKNEVSQ